jgi:hypothetical protein
MRLSKPDYLHWQVAQKGLKGWQKALTWAKSCPSWPLSGVALRDSLLDVLRLQPRPKPVPSY